jgi:S-adenosylmethionine uptake transporter
MQSLWMLVAALLFSCMGALVKLASDAHSAWELLFWRNLVGLILLASVIRQMKGGLRHNLATPYWAGHIVRNISGTISVAMWFTALAYLPLATTMTLNYTSSLFIGMILFVSAAWTGTRQHSLPMLATLIAGFTGIVMVLRPSIEPDQWVWAMLGIASGVLAAVAILSVRALGRLGESSPVIVFYFTLSGLFAGAIGMLVSGAHWPDTWHLILLLGVGITALLAQLAMTRAYSSGHTLLAANLNYSGIMFASFWGWLIWNDLLPFVSWLGIALIVAAGGAATWLTAQASQPTPDVD